MKTNQEKFQRSLKKIKIIIFNSYTYYSLAPVNDNNTQQVVYVDVNGTTEVSFTIPWQYRDEYERVGWLNSAPTAAYPSTPFIMWQYVMGPVGPSSTPIALRAMVEMRIPNFEGEVAELNVPQDASSGLPYIMQGKLTGELDDDLLLHTRRMTQYFTATLTSGTLAGQGSNYSFTIPALGIQFLDGMNVGLASQAFFVTNAPMTAYMWLSSMFYACSGGLVVSEKRTTTLASTVVIYESTQLPFAGSFSATAGTIITGYGNAYNTVGGFSERDSTTSRVVTIPDRLPYHFRCQRTKVSNVSPTGSLSTMTLLDEATYFSSGTGPETFMLYMAGAEDFRVGGFLTVPLLAAHP